VSDRIRVAFIDQVGGAAGGAEETLATFIENAPPELFPHAILFEDGAFADRLRRAGAIVDILDVGSAVVNSTREQLKVEVALQMPRIAYETSIFGISAWHIRIQ
jgi:hypothetical protein